MSDNDRSRHGKLVHVVAGVITDARGRILLARRTEGRDLAGLWEFPGGKVDAGETPEQALVRELREELGIEAKPGAAIIAVPQQYPDKRLRLDVRRIDAWSGQVKALDGQALAWVPPHKLATYAMPAADRPVVAALRDPDRYLVTPEPDTDSETWLAGLRASLDAGIRRVQLRARGIDASRWHDLASCALEICRAAGAEALINGEPELARRLHAGLHLRAEQLLRLEERPLPAASPVFASCHTLEELRHAERIGCDAVVLGPVFETETHPERSGIGWERFASMREHVALPIYAIGGMRSEHIEQARAHGAQGVAAIRGLWSVT